MAGKFCFLQSLRLSIGTMIPSPSNRALAQNNRSEDAESARKNPKQGLHQLRARSLNFWGRRGGYFCADFESHSERNACIVTDVSFEICQKDPDKGNFSTI